MFKSVNQLRGYTVLALDGNAGHIDDVYFDDRDWSVQFLVIDTGNLLPGKKVLVSPDHVENFDKEVQTLSLRLDLDTVEHCPDIYSNPPVSVLKKDLQDSQTDSIPMGRLGGGLFQEQTIGLSPDATVEMIQADEITQQQNVKGRRPTYLRSAKEVIDYYIYATDGDIGHVEDIFLGQGLLAVSYLIIDTRNWLPGKNVPLDPKWVKSIDWAENKIYISVPKSTIENQPEISF